MKLSTDLALDCDILFCPRSECSAKTHRAAGPLLSEILRQIHAVCVSVSMRIRADEDETNEANREYVRDSAAVAVTGRPTVVQTSRVFSPMSEQSSSLHNGQEA